MNDDKRRNARLQGRFSDEPKTSRKDKSKRKNDEGTSKRKSLEPKSADGVEIKYDEQADILFPELEEKKPAVEIKTPGEHVLSETDNGISRVIFEPDFIPEAEADNMMTLLKDSTAWYDKNIIIHGQEVPQPRLVAWYGPFPYAYSGAVLEAREMPPAIVEIKKRVERYLEAHQLCVDLNSVLLNLYRDGKDSVAWHSDDELTMGVSPTIASVSLGETRKFQMKIKQNVRERVENLVSEEYFVHLTSGSLIIMDGSMQKDWKHQVPKEYHDRAPRINLTFRTVSQIDKIPLQVPLKTVENSNHPSSTKTDAEKHIFDNTNFPSLESANSQNGNSSKVLKNSSAKSKSKTDSQTDAKASISNQSLSDDSLLLDSSYNSNASEDQELKNVPTSDDGNVCVSSDSDNRTDATKASNANSESASALAGMNELGHSAGESKRYELNADAIEFIPKFALPSDEAGISASVEFDKQQIVKLPDLFRGNKVPPSRYGEFYSALIEKLECNPEFLSDRDYYEVETLTQLYENGLTEINQEIVLSRLCSMIKNAARKNQRGYRPPPPRSGYRSSTYSRSRGSFKGSNSRGKD
nr:uncharacterized protein LOC107437569 [Parasteatoda tepidariorum]